MTAGEQGEPRRQDGVLFEEVQRFRSTGLWLLLLVSALLPVLLVGGVLFAQILLGRLVGDRPMTNPALVLALIFTVLLGGALLWLFAAARLVTRLEGDTLTVRFHPFTSRQYRVADLAHWEARRYRPVAEYGGWGIRKSSRGWAYTVSGNQGVQLELRDGSRLLVGSRRPEALVAALHEARRRA